MKPIHAGGLVKITGGPYAHANKTIATGYLVPNTGGVWPYHYPPTHPYRLLITKTPLNLVFPILPIWPGDVIAVVK